MTVGARRSRVVAVVVVILVIGVSALFAQLPIPVQGQRGEQGGNRRRGRGRGPGARAAAGSASVVSRRSRRPSPRSPGRARFYETLMELKPGDDLAHFKLRDEGILRIGHRERPALQDAHRHSEAGRQRQVQRTGSRRVDASERQPLDVPLHPHVLDDRRPHRSRNSDERRRRVSPNSIRIATRICRSATGRRARSSRRLER